MNDYEKLIKLEAEWDLYIETSHGLWNVERSLKEFQQKGGSIETLRLSLLGKAVKFLKSLDKKEEIYPSEIDRLSANLLIEQHGITLGEKIPFNHPGVGVSGFLRVERVSIAMDDENEGTFYASGRQFKKDGKIGKRQATCSLRFRKPL